MEVHFSPDVEMRLRIENQGRIISGLQKGINQADHGESVEHQEVLMSIDRLFHS
jgi:predicted transcriptional regulator